MVPVSLGKQKQKQKTNQLSLQLSLCSKSDKYFANICMRMPSVATVFKKSQQQVKYYPSVKPEVILNKKGILHVKPLACLPSLCDQSVQWN